MTVSTNANTFLYFWQQSLFTPALLFSYREVLLIRVCMMKINTYRLRFPTNNAWGFERV
nr:MAG TPA: hypothetical protein [Bacteriophage sp.]